MGSASWVLTAAITSVVAFSLWKCLRFVLHRAVYRSPLRHLRGPKSTNFILGNLSDANNEATGELAAKWLKEYGETFRYKGFLNSHTLYTVDTRAISHILTNSNDYQKPSHVREDLAQIFGEGLLIVEGAQHRQQRRILNPAFGPAQIRELTDTFLTEASHLRDIWYSEIINDPTGWTTMNVAPWLNKVTLNIIGLTGFGYCFDSLDSREQPDELSDAFSTMSSASQTITMLDILQAFIPILRLIPTAKSRKIRAAKHSMMQIGKQLLAKARAVVLSNETGKGDIEKNNLRGRDLLSLLVKANMATDIPESQRLSDDDVIAQVPTFLVAGHETTSTAVTWALYAMTKAPEVQTKLRDELLSIDTDTPSMDELMALPYLDAVVRETLRVHAPVSETARVAMKDDVIPVEKPYVDRHGVVRDTIAIAKGDDINIPILQMNRSQELWGPDANEFKPERWNNVPEGVSRVPGVWGHLLTFISGPRGCIGYRFSLVEFKAILFILVRSFEFEFIVPAGDICAKTGWGSVTQRPVLRNDPTNQVQLPLKIRAFQRT